MNRVELNGQVFNTPASYNELTRHQLLRLCRLLIIGTKKVPGKLITDEDLMARVLLLLMGIKRGILKHGAKTRAFLKAPSKAHAYLMHDEAVTGWVFDRANLTAYTIADFKHKGVKYYGPHNYLLNIPIEEMVEAMMYFSAYVQSQKKEPKADLLDKMIAVLYRPGRLFYAFEKLTPGFILDRRVKNNPYRFEQRVERFAQLPEELKMAIFLQFEGALSDFAKSFPKSFGKKGDGADPAGFIKLLMSMSNDIFGNYEQTLKVDSYTFFTKVEQNITQAAKLERQMK